jgi:hypothetical protein
MSLRLVSVGLLLLIAVSTSAQIPAPQQLSAEDSREFNKELERLQRLLASANDKGPVELQLANTYAAGGQFTEAMRRLREVVGANLGFDPSRVPDFAHLRDTAEFRSIMKEVVSQTPPVHNSRLVGTINQADVLPENIAFDIRWNAFLLGSMASPEIVRCSLGKVCVPLVKPHNSEKGYVLGLRSDKAGDTVLATLNTPSGAGLRRYNVKSGRLLQTAYIEGKHVFNDLAISSRGAVYVTDTSEGSIYQLDTGSSALRRIAPLRTFTAANGIAISADERKLYVSAWGDGIDVVDIPSGAVKAMPHPDSICLAFIDGLYATAASLIAIQNGPMLPRIVQFKLGDSGKEIVGMRILERRNPVFDGITTGVLVGSEFYYVANPQTDKKNSAILNPLQVLSVPVVP